MRLIVASASTARSFSASRRSICSCLPASSAAIAASPIRLVSNPTGPPTPSSQNDFQWATSGSSLLIPAPFLGAGDPAGNRPVAVILRLHGSPGATVLRPVVSERILVRCFAIHRREVVARFFALSVGIVTVSYTHLRAHETDSYLV